ncbi:PREDICTED: B3 domain-containing protein REM10-like [Camelina sativa]|uniref:B3 domain-containing protein REM10-like n=1 Tax=Camelina sativa TaxID=90675 RepID=A0ABM0XPF6_CAMSA|nr:PREDICTED: B3 domain-containing protein REM10-like [Camelina sativa]
MENVSPSSPINPHFFQPLLPGFHSYLNIPMRFFLRHIDGPTNEDNAVVKLRSDVSDITWQVKMEGRRLTKGWKKFAASHDLRVGDIVVFRHDGGLLFHVTCFGPSCCEIQYDYDDVIQISSDSDSENNQNIADEGSSSDHHSCFVARVTASNLRKDSLFLPRGFSRSNGLMKRKCEIILLNEDGIPWKLILSHKPDGEVYIRLGWRSFCFENRLRVNDVLSLKLVQTGTTPVLQLCSSSTTSQNRFLTLTLKPYNLKKYKLCLPGTFVKANGIERARKITLVDQYNIKRTTSLKPDDKHGKMRLGKEWREFCYVNGVNIGESFKLEIIKETEDTATHLLKFCSKVVNFP